MLILIDGSYYLYRAYKALPLLTNSLGEPTGGIYGVINMLKSILLQYNFKYFAIVFDAQGKTFRNNLFKYYKSHRLPMPHDLCNQIIPMYNIIKAMGLPLLVISGVEADDVIGTLALTAANDGRKVLIITGDKDLTQLVSTNIKIINTISNTILGPKEVQLKFGVPPNLIIDYFTLIGDKSDNIMGVPGIGKKTTLILLHKLGGLKNIYQQLDKIKNIKFRSAKIIETKLKQYREIIFISYQLVKIKTNVALNLSYDKLTLKIPNKNILKLLFQHYEFKYWIKNIEQNKLLQNIKNKILK
ncbi:DNA polymerase I [Candidatus Mikella endobia]|uniref:DNA polymerase I n=1 Tax=Candidatus Mikella endobia TaxID=1778264 RepID=A0A143WPQ4_9ENTR|nr:5'-3' exonuclease H3TH domain-containing protein [Candidatus Mikella endobia]CUX95690.1 DNA polymerase I [Candidatus Mikella endobia]